MIVRILKKSETFKGVQYNTSKIEKEKGELMKVRNFGALQALDQLRPQDYRNYLEAISARNSRIKFPQFHAVISAKGKSYSKQQLTEIAEQWLNGMGYREQPYLLVFHKDTGNNHIHIVTTRVDREGKKIPDSYEKIRAYQVLNRILGTDKKKAVVSDLEKALSYNFSTRAQFMMILEAQGYALSLSGADYQISKYGKELSRIALTQVDGRITEHQKDKDRIGQLRAIIEKYRFRVDPAIYMLTRELPGGKGTVLTGYSSKLAELLRDKFGLQILFHSKDGKPPYGYTILDHAAKAVFKGGEVMSMKEFIAPLPGTHQTSRADNQGEPSEELRQESKESQFEAEEITGKQICDEPYPGQLPDADTEVQAGYVGQEPGYLPELQIDIADDIDDEQILGRNRRRKRKARTNTR